MSIPLIIIVTLIYAGVSIDHALSQKWGGCVMFLGYAIGNLGILMLVKDGVQTH